VQNFFSGTIALNHKFINNIKNPWVTGFPEGADPALLADAGTGEDGEIFQW